MTLLKKIEVGALGRFEYNGVLARFGFLSSFKTIIVSPILHRNMNKLMGIRNKTGYMAYKIMNNKFIAVHESDCNLNTWDIYTGKKEQKPYHAPNINL